MKKLLVILGPTATGKTELGLHLAKKFNGELVACDSRQIYRGLDIGTGKLPDIINRHPELACTERSECGSGSDEEMPKPFDKTQGKQVRHDMNKGKGFWEVGRIRIWMYDMVDPKKQYTVADYVKDADRVIRKIWEMGKLPIIVGGTGLYLKALLEGIPNLNIPVDMDLRKKLERLSLDKLQEKLKKLSSNRWKKLNESDRQNPRRLVRAIELIMSSLRMQGSNKLSLVRNWIPAYAGMTGTDVLKVGLTAPRDILYKNADARVLSWIDQGIIKEVKKLQANGVSLKRMRQLGLEYRTLADFLDGKIRETPGDKGLIKLMQNKIHGYIRRQLTWFKREKEVSWFDITNKDYINNVEILVGSWYHELK